MALVAVRPLDQHTSLPSSPSDDLLLRRLGAAIRHYRQQRRLSQRALATQTGLSDSHCRAIELGQQNPSVLVILRLAHALGIPSAWLVLRLESNDPLPSLEAQAAAFSSTPALTPASQGALLSLLGATLRQYRQQHHLSQRALAAMIDLDASYIGQVERGERNITILTLLHLADAVELSVHRLFAIVDSFRNSLPALPG